MNWIINMKWGDYIEMTNLVGDRVEHGLRFWSEKRYILI